MSSGQPGVSTITTFTPLEVKGPGPAEQFLTLNCTIKSGQNLVKGTLIGPIGTDLTKMAAFLNTGVASATVPVMNPLNTGNGTIAIPAVQDAYTESEDWTIEVTTTGGTGVGKAKVTGSVSGLVSAVDGITVGTLFRYPDTAAYKFSFTLVDGGVDWTDGDLITFSTVKASPLAAAGILAQDCDATDGDRLASMWVRGNFVIANLVGYEVSALADLNGKSVSGYLIM